MNRTAGIAPVILAASAAAQVGNTLFFNFPNGNVYTGAKPVVVELWTQFDPQYYALAHWKGDVNSTDQTGNWSNFVNISLVICEPSGCYQTSGGSLVSVIVPQLHFPPIFLAKTDNPIRLFSIEWSSPDLTERKVDLETATSTYSLFLNFSSGMSINLSPEQGAGTIRVVPSPGAMLSAFGLFMIASRRTRR